MSVPDDPSKNLYPNQPEDRLETGALPTFDPEPIVEIPQDTAVPAKQEALAGSIGAYELVAKLGEGGMGEVWLAEQTAPVKRQVALKLIRSGTYNIGTSRREPFVRQITSLYLRSESLPELTIS